MSIRTYTFVTRSEKKWGKWMRLKRGPTGTSLILRMLKKSQVRKFKKEVENLTQDVGKLADG